MKASKQAVLDAKAKVKAEWVIVKELRNRRSNMAEMEIEIARLTKERDDARRMYCEHQFIFHNPNKQKNYHELTALENNWDCYKETT